MASPKIIPGLRWYIATVLCLATTLNYLDRQTLSLLAPTLQRELGITTLQYANMTAAFLISYTIMYAVSGRLIDLLGVRRGLSVFVGAWSLANLLHALARTALQFSFCRFLLGAAEPANFPAGVKAVSSWFPVRERALAVGIFNSGSALGAGLAAPMVAWITLAFGWRYAFVGGAALGAVWILLWQMTYREPQEHPRLGAEELRLIEEGKGAPQPEEPVSLRRILKMPEAWGCILARMLTDPISYLFIFWVPKFLQEERGFSLAAMGRYGWIPFLALTIGNLASGAIPRWLIQRGWSIDRARKTVMGAVTILMPTCFILITRVPNPAWALTLISIAMFCHASWGNITLPSEVMPNRIVGAVTGFGGCMGSLVSTFVTLVIGRLVTSISFTPVFLLYSAAPITAYAIVVLLIKDLGRIREVPAA